MAGVKTAIAVALFGLLTALAPYLRTNMPVYADSAQIQLSMKYHNPHVCVNGKRVLPKVDEGFSPLDLLGRRALKADKGGEEEEAAEKEKEGEGASTSYLTLYDIKGKPDIKAALEHFVHDYYSVQLFVRPPTSSLTPHSPGPRHTRLRAGQLSLCASSLLSHTLAL